MSKLPFDQILRKVAGRISKADRDRLATPGSLPHGVMAGQRAFARAWVERPPKPGLSLVVSRRDILDELDDMDLSCAEYRKRWPS